MAGWVLSFLWSRNHIEFVSVVYVEGYGLSSAIPYHPSSSAPDPQVYREWQRRRVAEG